MRPKVSNNLKEMPRRDIIFDLDFTVTKNRKGFGVLKLVMDAIKKRLYHGKDE